MRFPVPDDNRTYDLTGQAEPLTEILQILQILQILKANRTSGAIEVLATQ